MKNTLRCALGAAGLAALVTFAATVSAADAPVAKSSCKPTYTDLTDAGTLAVLENASVEQIGEAESVRLSSTTKVSRARVQITDGGGNLVAGTVECTATCNGGAAFCSVSGCDASEFGCSTFSCFGSGCTSGSCTKKTTASVPPAPAPAPAPTSAR
jgi:hypothetical protein